MSAVLVQFNFILIMIKFVSIFHSNSVCLRYECCQSVVLQIHLVFNFAHNSSQTLVSLQQFSKIFKTFHAQNATQNNAQICFCNHAFF